MNEHMAGHEELPRTAYLDHTLRRARTAAEQRSHRYVTLEHLLLTLLDDPDAAKLLQITGSDVAAIHGAVSEAVNNRMASLVSPGTPPSFSYRFDALFQCANEDAISLSRPEIDGALALLAIAKDAESNASAILAANGFDPETAMKAMKRSAQRQRSLQPASTLPRAPAAAAATPAAGGDIMDDMIASVRTILEEESKDREFSQRTAPMSRHDPKFNGNGRPEDGAARAEPRIGPSAPVMRSLHDAPGAGGFSEAPPAAFDLEKPPRIQKGNGLHKTARRRSPGNVALLAKIFDTVPRKARAGVSQKVQIALSREEAGLLFGRTVRHPTSAGNDGAGRAVTVRLSAPDGEFFVVALTPETQWSEDTAGGGPFGRWVWTVTPKASGLSRLKASISARDVDANGAGAATALPDQTIKVRVHGNVWLALQNFLSTLLLMLAGSGLTVTAWYVLKIAGKFR